MIFREVAYGKDDVRYPLLFQMRQQDFQERLASNRAMAFGRSGTADLSRVPNPPARMTASRIKTPLLFVMAVNGGRLRQPEKGL